MDITQDPVDLGASTPGTGVQATGGYFGFNTVHPPDYIWDAGLNQWVPPAGTTGNQNSVHPPGWYWDPNTGTWVPPANSQPAPPVFPPGQQDTNTIPPPSATPPPGGGTTPPPSSGSTVPPGTLGDLIAPFTTPAPSYIQPAIPNAPTFPNIPAFQQPTADEAAQNPGYQFALQQGVKAVDQSAASRGVLNTGGTLEDIINYGQNAATQNYQNVVNNDEATYAANLESQYLLPYQAAYNTWQTQVPVAQQNAAAQNTFNWNDYLQGYNIFNNQQQNTFNKLYAVATLGTTAQ